MESRAEMITPTDCFRETKTNWFGVKPTIAITEGRLSLWCRCDKSSNGFRLSCWCSVWFCLFLYVECTGMFFIVNQSERWLIRVQTGKKDQCRFICNLRWGEGDSVVGRWSNDDDLAAYGEAKWVQDEHWTLNFVFRRWSHLFSICICTSVDCLRTAKLPIPQLKLNVYEIRFKSFSKYNIWLRRHSNCV